MNRISKIELTNNYLPYGAKKEIAKTVGLSTTTVNEFFKGFPKSKATENKILEASKPHVDANKKSIKDLENNIITGIQLPYGSKKKIAKITGLSAQMVVNFFNGIKVNKENGSKILETSQLFLKSNKSKFYVIALGQELPHGAKKKIAEITGISEQTICNFFKTGLAGIEVTKKIIEASKPFIVNYNAVKKAQSELKKTLGK